MGLYVQGLWEHAETVHIRRSVSSAARRLGRAAFQRLKFPV